MIRRYRVFRELVALGQPVVLYLATILLALATFTGSLWFTTSSWDHRKMLVVAAIWVSCLGGALFGQVVSVTRLRSGLFLMGSFFGFWVAVYVLVQFEPMLKLMLGEVATIFIGIGLMLGSIFASGGFWSLRVNRGLFASWAPAVLFTSSIIIVTEDAGRDAAWHEGAKYAIWSAGTISILALAVVLQLAFMVGRERHRLFRWRTGPNAPELVEERPDPWRPFAGLGTLVMLGILVVALTGASAIVAPYLWRTGPRDGDDGGGQNTQQPDEPDDYDPSGGGGGAWGQKLQRYAKQGVQMGCALITMLVLAIAGLIVFGLPTRRQLLLSHLRDPMWPVPPSRRARLHWRLAEIALGDAGIHRKPGDSARDVALRAVDQYPDVNLEALVTAAEIADRVMYGYALDASDADTIRRAAEMTYQAVWDTLGEAERLRATYRLL